MKCHKRNIGILLEKRFVTYRFWDLRRLQGREVAVKMSWGYILAPAEGEGHEGVPPPPDKDLESPSSTRLEALVPSRDSRARTPRHHMRGSLSSPLYLVSNTTLEPQLENTHASHVGGATGRTPPIPRSALEKDPRPGPLFEGNPVHRPENPAGSTYSSTTGLS